MKVAQDKSWGMDSLGQPVDESGEGLGQNPYVFIVGCPRSGTTLLQRMLDNHPLLAVSNDSHFIPEAIRDVPVGIDPPLTPQLVEWVRGYRRFPRLGLPDNAVVNAADQSQTYGQFVGALYSHLGKLKGKTFAGEKTPDYCRNLPRLHSLFPWVKSIHIIRDGRDVALSTLEWAQENKGPGRFSLWKKEPVAVCALWWQWQVSTARRDGGELGPARYREVGYEHLVAGPEESLRNPADFLELPFAREMLEFHQGKTKSNPKLSAKSAWLPPTPGLRDWYTQMKERDLELFEAIAGDLLSDLGYERAFDAISPEIAAVAERCRQWWESERISRRKKGHPGSVGTLEAGIAQGESIKAKQS